LAVFSPLPGIGVFGVLRPRWNLLQKPNRGYTTVINRRRQLFCNWIHGHKISSRLFFRPLACPQPARWFEILEISAATRIFFVAALFFPN